MTSAATILAPNSAFSAALRNTRAMRPATGRNRLAAPAAALLTASAATQRRPGVAANLGPVRAAPRIEPHIAAGDVERRQAGVGILRQAAAPGLDQARLRPAGACGAAVLRQRSGAAQLARQRDDRAVQRDNSVDLDHPGDALLRGGRDDAVGGSEERPGIFIDRDVAAIALLCLSDD